MLFQMALATLLLNNGICPTLIRKGRNILLLEVQEFRIRFLATNNYISGNEVALANQFNIPFSNDFISTENLQINFTQNNLKEIEIIATETLKLLMKSILTFVHKSFEFQISLRAFLKKSEIFNVVNPFNSPVCSISSFVYLVYKIFF